MSGIEKKFLPQDEQESKKKNSFIDGRPAYPLGTKLSEEIAEFKVMLEFPAGDHDTIIETVNEFKKILNDMFLLMHHHRYGVLYNILKKFR